MRLLPGVLALLAASSCASPRTEPPSVALARAVLLRSEREADARSGALFIRCTPDDAEVWVDGARKGACSEVRSSPLRLGNGMHRVDVKKDGFLPYVTYYDPNETEGAAVGLVRAGLHIRLTPLQNAEPGEAR